MASIAQGNAPAAANLKRLIEESGVPQYIIARKIGLGTHQLSDMMQGRKIIRPCDLVKLQQVLGVEFEEIFAPPLPKKGCD